MQSMHMRDLSGEKGEGWRGKNSNKPKSLVSQSGVGFWVLKCSCCLITPSPLLKSLRQKPRFRIEAAEEAMTHSGLTRGFGWGWGRQRNDNVIPSWLADRVPEMVAHTVSLLALFWHILSESHPLLCRMSRFNCSRQESTEALLSQSEFKEGEKQNLNICADWLQLLKPSLPGPAVTQPVNLSLRSFRF